VLESASAGIVALYDVFPIFVASFPSTVMFSNCVSASSLYIVKVYVTLSPFSAVTWTGIVFFITVVISTVFVVSFVSSILASILTVVLSSLATACTSGFVTESFIMISYPVELIGVACTLSIVRLSKLASFDNMFIVNM